MSGSAEYTLGSTVRCADGDAGELRRVVMEPDTRLLTHLVVEPDGGIPRLVPAAIASVTPDGAVWLRCTLAGLETFERAEATREEQTEADEWDYKPDEAASWGGGGLGADHGLGPAEAAGPVSAGGDAAVWDRVPAGEVQVRPRDRVRAADGEIGKLRGVMVDGDDGRVTHVLLDEGHLWRRKRVALPIGAVVLLDQGGVELRMTKSEVRGLPALHA